MSLEIRSGGRFAADRSVPEALTRDAEVFLGQVDTDLAIRLHPRWPTTGVVAPLEVSPNAIFWDPATFRIDSWEELRESGATVHHQSGAAFVSYLVSAGYVRRNQLDGTSDGTIAKLVATEGAVVQQGLVTRAPYQLTNVVDDWRRPVEYLLVHDAGFRPYPGPLAVASSRLEEPSARSCLRALVPLVQQSVIDFQTDPTAANDLIVKVLNGFGEGSALGSAGATNAVVQMGRMGIVGNGNDRAVGNFDPQRVTALLNWYEGHGRKANPGSDDPAAVPAVDQVITNQFIDSTIGL